MSKSRERSASWTALLLFLGLSAGLAWSLWMYAALMFSGSPNLFIFAGAWMPSVSALIVVGYTGGSDRVYSLLRSLIRWRARWHWYLIAVFAFPVLALVAAALHMLTVGNELLALETLADHLSATDTTLSSVLLQFPAVYLMHMIGGGPIAEELGWRGFAQPVLQSWIGAAPAGLAVGVIWSLWHLPMFFFFPEMTGQIPLGYHVVMMAAASVLFAWVYNGTGQSVLFCIFFHASLNVSTSLPGLVPVEQSESLLVTFVLSLSLVAGLIFSQMMEADHETEDEFFGSLVR